MRELGITVLLTMVIIIGLASLSNAQMAQSTNFDHTQKLLQTCQSSYDVDYGYCAGFISAIADVMQQYELYGVNACPNIGIKSQQLMDNVVGYIHQNQDLKTLPAKEAVAQSLSNLFPCR